jgi:hypothetical protein
MNASFFYWRCSVVEKGAVNGYKIVAHATTQGNPLYRKTSKINSVGHFHRPLVNRRNVNL